MKTPLLILFMLITTIDTYAQSPQQNYPFERMDAQKACDPETIFTLAPKNPSYTGGLTKLENDLRESMAEGLPKEGKYFLKMLINCKGELVGSGVLKGDANESKLLISKLGKLQNWNPAEQNYKKVDCYYLLFLEVRNGTIFINNKW